MTVHSAAKGTSVHRHRLRRSRPGPVPRTAYQL